MSNERNIKRRCTIKFHARRDESLPDVSDERLQKYPMKMAVSNVFKILKTDVGNKFGLKKPTLSIDDENIKIVRIAWQETANRLLEKRLIKPLRRNGTKRFREQVQRIRKTITNDCAL